MNEVEKNTKIDLTQVGENDTSSTPVKMNKGCIFLFHQYQIVAILVLAAAGVGLGIGLSFWNPEDAETKQIVIQWIGLVGDLFLRALKCFVLPLVFVNVIIAVVDMMSIGKASAIGWTVIGLYLFTTVAAAFFGSMSTLVFMGYYTTDDATTNNGDSNGDMIQISLSDTIYKGIFEKIVPDNIVGAFSNNEFAAVIFFAVLFGAALAPVIFKKKINGKGISENSSLLEMLKESDSVFQRITRWIISLTPFAVFSLIAAAIGEQDNLGDMFSNIGLLIAAAFVAWGFQVVFVYIGLFALLTKSNPFRFLKHIIPAQTMAFATASSAASIPTSLAAIKSTGMVPDTIGRFVIPFGATVNMDGGAVYFVCACIWLAVLNGEDITVSSFLLLIIIATVGSIGTAPVPSASLVLIITAYNTVFQGTGTPNGFGYIFAIDWFMDRCRTTTNITGDCVVAGIIAHRCPVENDNEMIHESEDANSMASSDIEELSQV